MPRRMFKSYICPLCKSGVEEYSLDNDSEWLLTKRGLKQYFHHSCYDNMIKRQKEEQRVKA